MSDGRHSAPGDQSFVVSLAKHAGAAVALVVVVALAFWGIGSIRGGDDDPVVAAPSDSPSVVVTTDPTDTPSATDDPVISPSAPAGPTGDPSPTAAPSPDATTAAPDPDEGDQEHDPGDVSIQVLDAVGSDGGAAARRVADELRADGYDVIVVNRASRTYAETTVFYVAGHQGEAQQIAEEYGFPVVEEKPDNLSDSVDIHLVVGTDEA